MIGSRPTGVAGELASLCPSCGSEVARRLPSCPVCGWLVHGAELERLAREAQEAQDAGDLTTALQRWRRALELLPPASRQFQQIRAHLEELSRRVDAGGSAPAKNAAERPPWLRGGGALGGLGLLVWKAKWLALLVLSKGKLLLLGLTKGTTLLSMLLAAGVYWSLWGWKFALGFVLAIYVHEMGHVVALQRLGIRASAPMFLPGVGAFVRLGQYPTSAREDARVGLAGPIWGLGAVLVAYALYLGTGATSLAAIARFSAWVNLFNLLPVWQLDGSRGFRALGRGQRLAVAGAMALMLLATREGLLVLLGLAAGARALFEVAPAQSDRPAFASFLMLVVALSLLAVVEVPGLPVAHQP